MDTTSEFPYGRAKEFRCLCDITRVTYSPHITLRESIYEIVALLPGGFRCRDVAWARVTLNNEEFITRGRAVSNRKISSDIIIRGKVAGTVEVGYIDGTPEYRAGVFTLEEQLLLDAVAEHLSAIAANLQAEEALRLSEEKFSKAFHASPNIVMITELEDGRVIDINNSSLHLVGWPPQELIGRRSTEIGFWKSEEQRRRAVERLNIDGRLRDAKIEWRRRSGEIRLGRLSSELITVGGKPCIISVISDITQQKESQEMFQTIARSSPFGIFILQDGAFTYTNPQFENITGYSCAELRGRELLSIVAAEDSDVVAAGIIFTMRQKNPRPCEYRLLAKSGQIKWVVQTVSRIRYRRGNAILGNIMDVTELKYLERKVVEYEELSKMKSDLLATVSHELRTPLATIKGYATMILDYFSRLDPKRPGTTSGPSTAPRTASPSSWTTSSTRRGWTPASSSSRNRRPASRRSSASSSRRPGSGTPGITSSPGSKPGCPGSTSIPNASARCSIISSITPSSTHRRGRK